MGQGQAYLQHLSHNNRKASGRMSESRGCRRWEVVEGKKNKK